MAAVSVAQMRALEAAAIQQGWTEEALMDLAGERLGKSLAEHFPKPGNAIGYLGKGHNAGDTLIALRILRDRYGWKIHTREAYAHKDLAPLTQKKYASLHSLSRLDEMPAWRDLPSPLLLIDGLLGIGAHGALRKPLADLAAEMASLRSHAGAITAAVDLPSGVNPDNGEISSGSVMADITFMIGNAKSGLLQGKTAAATGKLALVPVEPLQDDHPGSLQLISPQNCDFGKARRPFDFHKGQAGRISLLVGSADYSGAAVMAATGALKGGAGLITVWVPHSIRLAVSQKCPPEVIVRGMDSPLEALEMAHDAMVIGCGIGAIDPSKADDWIQLLQRGTKPTVLDADILNFIAASGNTHRLAAHHIVTPHPGEFARLAPDLTNISREAAAQAYVSRTPVTLLLKGSRTIITRQNESLWINSTGSPGMATGGQGDLLAGVIGARLAGGMPAIDATCHAAWLCGRAAERALNHPDISEESLLPEDVARHLGGAFQDWRCSLR